ncbi:hypothetical protein BG004_000855 [Podila humilis]|nr:hypothetical protein BG004_000855 [Podila humilis]
MTSTTGQDPDLAGDFLGYKDLTLELDAKLIFDPPPHHFQTIVYVKRQHELLDTAIRDWVQRARDCHSDSLQVLQRQVALLSQGVAGSADGRHFDVRGHNRSHQQRLMQALLSVGPELHSCPPEALPVLLEFLAPMVLGKQRQDGSRESHIAQVVFETKKEMSKAIYALSGTLNHAIAFKESFIMDKTDIFLRTLDTWKSIGKSDTGSIKAMFSGPRSEVKMFSALMFPPVEFPLEEFKPYFSRFCHSLMLPVSYRDLESLDPIISTPGQKSGYLFHRDRNGEWNRQYFYIMPRGMLMQFAKGKDIQIANLNQTLLRTINLDSRDFVFEICSIEVYLMESILQASTKVEFEEWKAALFYWHPPDDEIPQIESLKVSTPPTKHMFPRPRHLSLGRVSDATSAATKSRISVEYQHAKAGDIYVLDVTSKPMNAQNKIGIWRPIHCIIRPNGHFVQYNVGEKEKPFETIPLADILRTHIWGLDGSLFGKKHCFSIRSTHTQDVNYYTVSLKRTSTDQETFNSWLYTLKFYAKAEVFGASAQLEYRLYRTFWIIVNDGRRLPKDLEAYCEITLDDQRRARTSTRTKLVKGTEPDAPYWRDSFEFTDLAAVNKGITINVIQVKGSKLIPFGRTHIPVRNNDEYDEGWYPILNNNDRTRSTEHLGDLRLKLKYEEQIVLPVVNYADLLDIIVNFQENNVISKLAELVTDLEGFSRNVLRILEGKGMAVIWLNTLIDDEIAEARPTRVNTLFRGNTLLTKALDAYMRLVGTEYLDDTLGDILRAICKNKAACEVDPSKLEKHEDLKRRLTEKFSGKSAQNDQDVDTELASLARYTGVSGFVFLRLICPAILGPKLFHIVREHPEPRAHRTLTLIAKSLQGLANLVPFGTKENWMQPMNEFINENTQSLKDFIDQICLSGSSAGVDSSANSIRSIVIQPNSPGSTTSSIFRAYQSSSKNSITGGVGGVGSAAGAGSSFQTGGTANLMHPLPSPSAQNRSSARPPFLKEGSNRSGHSSTTTAISAGPSHAGGESQSNYGNNSNRTNNHGSTRTQLLNENGVEVDRTNLDLPLLPHLIDLGKELSHFSTTVARVVPPWPSTESEGKAERPQADQNGGGRRTTEDCDEGEFDDDVLIRVGRVCWELIETIQERVELSVEMEQEERRRAAQGFNNNGGSGGGGYNSKSKISREGSRDGEESYFVYEHEQEHDQVNDHDYESFEGYGGRGSYDSEDESFEYPGPGPANVAVGAEVPGIGIAQAIGVGGGGFDYHY